MTKTPRLPEVVIVGRTNVGKSTLFNRLSEQVKTLALNYEGVTRDFIKDTICWQERCFSLVDSGGISLQKSADKLAEKVRQVGLQLVKQSDVIVFVIDGAVGVTNEDRAIGKLLHSLGKKVIVAVNKIDTHAAQEQQYECATLGFSDCVPISAQHGKGIDDLLDALIAVVPQKPLVLEEKQLQLGVVLLGKPNVGKSSLMNLLLDQQRMLVSEVAGTTREAVTEPITFYQETFTLTDTPGIRRKRKVEEPLEKLMVKSAFSAAASTNIVLLLVDACEGRLSDQELKLAFYAFDRGKGLLVLINKADLLTEELTQQFTEQFDQYKQLFGKIPHLFISCTSKKNVGKIVPLVHQIWQRYNQVFADQELTTILKEALIKTPLYTGGKMLQINKVRQISTAPITLLLNVSNPKMFGPTQCAFFENKLRAAFDLRGVPVMFEVRRG